MNRILLCLAYLLLSIDISAQNNDTLLSDRDMKGDFEIYKTVLKESHAGLYRYISPVALENEWNFVAKEIEKPLPRNQFFQLLLKNTARLEHGHSFLADNRQNGINYMLRDLAPDQAYLPFTLKIIDDKAYIAVDCATPKHSNSGLQIISINGIPMDSLLNDFRQYIPADGGNTSYENFKLEKFGFHFLYHLLYPAVNSYQLVCRSPKGTRTTIKVDGIRPSALEERYTRVTGKSVNYFPPSLAYRLLDKTKQLGYLKVGSFYEGLTNRNGVDFIKFIDSAFQQIASQKIGRLILDLRDNEGGNDALAILLFSYLTEKPFSQGNPTYIKSDHLSMLKYIHDPEEDIIQFAQHPELFLDKVGSEFVLKKEFDDISFQVYQPKQPVYKGKLIILTNGGSFSATSRFINTADHYIHDRKRVRFVGENYGGNDGSGFATGGQSISVLLPYSQFRLSIPLKEFSRFRSSEGKGTIVLDKKIDMDPKHILEDIQLQRTIDYANKL